MKPEPEHLETIFAHVIQLKLAEERAAYLEQACAGNPELLKRVEVLLKAHDASGNFLRPATIDMPSIAERPGTVIGPYKLMEQIGEGGMGLVFVAEQQQPVRRKVALKVIKPGMDTRDVIARFEAERQALALMDHPNIAKVLDAGATESGRPYFVMELVRGVPLTDYCDQSQLTPRQRLELFVNVCKAVQHAHTKGIIHRDLKPSNVLVTLHDGTPVVKVIDFGVAKALGRQLTEKTIYTGFMQMIGTPLYMSPEQAQMSGLDIDTRSDVYSLGVLLYELLTGTTPFDKERLKTAALDEIRRIIREEEPPRPSLRLTTLGESLSAISARRKTEPRKLSGLVRGDLDWIVMNCLDKDRTRRYETANALADDLRRYLNEQPIEARPPSAGYLLRKFARRNRKPIMVAATMLAAVICGAIALGWAIHRAGDVVDKRLEIAEAKRLADEKNKRDEEQRELERLKLEQAERERRQVEETKLKRVWQGYAKTLEAAQVDLGAFKKAESRQALDTCEPDFRGWEHDYLVKLANPQPKSFSIPQGKLVLSPDGKYLAVDTAGGLNARKTSALKIWDVAAGKAVLEFSEDSDFIARNMITGMVFSPDSNRLAISFTAYGDNGKNLGHKGVRVLDLKDRKELLSLPALEGQVAKIGLNSDSNQLLTASIDAGNMVVKKWNIVNGIIASGFEVDAGKAPKVWQVTFSPDGRRFAYRSGSGSWSVWSLDTGKKLSLSGSYFTLNFSPDGRFLVTTITSESSKGKASIAQTITIWNADNGKLVQTLKLATAASGTIGETKVLALSEAGSMLAVLNRKSGQFGIEIRPVDSGQNILTLEGNYVQKKDVSMWVSMHGSKLMLLESTNGRLTVWDLPLRPLLLHMAALRTIAFSRDGNRVVSASQDGTIKLSDAATGQELRTFKDFADSVTSVALSPDGNLLASASPNGPKSVTFWDVNSGKEVLTLTGQTSAVNCVAFSPDGRHLATAAQDNLARLWDVQSGKGLLTLKGHGGPVASVAFSLDGTRLATASRDHTVRLWDAATGEPLAVGKRHHDVVNCVAFSPDGKRLASASDDKTIKVWDAASGQELATLEGHVGSVRGVVFHPDGNRLASASDDKTIKIWEPTYGQELLTLKGHAGAVNCVDFSPDGKQLTSGSADGAILIWDASRSMK